MGNSQSSPRPGALRLELRWGWYSLATPALLALMAAGWAGSASPERPLDSEGFWKTGVPAAIVVEGGRARFRVPTPDVSSETLVVVSALARTSGPFEISLSAQSAQRAATPPTVAPERVPRTPIQTIAPLATVSDDAMLALPPRERDFHIMVREGDSTSPRNYADVRGLLLGVGRRVQVYLDSTDADHDFDDVVKDLIICFDDRIFPDTVKRYGPARDVDGDGRFTILISSWLDHLGGGQHSVDGFVRVADLDPTINEPISNRCDMMYLNSRLKSSAYLKTVVAHEYMHAVVSSQKGNRSSPESRTFLEEEGWLDEAMAHVAEEQHGFTRANIDYRVSAFLSRPERYQLVVDDYYAADLFRSHGNRGSTYLFLRWCVERYGAGLLPALIGSSRKGIDNLEGVTGASFDELYRRWSVALFFSGWNPAEIQAGNVSDQDRGLHLREPWDEWEMAGPRMSRITAGTESERWVQFGTTSHFAIIEGSASGAVEIEVTAPVAARLQVTAIPLGAKLPRLQLSVTEIARSSEGSQVVVRAEELHGVPVRLSALAWEMLTPGPNPQASGFVRGRLDMLGIASKLGTSALPAHGVLTSAPICLKRVDHLRAPLVFKLTATDASGRRVAAWAEFAPRSVESDSLSRTGL